MLKTENNINFRQLNSLDANLIIIFQQTKQHNLMVSKRIFLSLVINNSIKILIPILIGFYSNLL